MALRGQKKAAFLARMKRGRAKAARSRGGGTKRRKAPAKRRASRKAPAKRRATATRSAPAKRRRPRKTEGVLTGILSASVPTVAGIVVAGALARAVPAANTPMKRAGIGIGSALALAMFSKFLARNVPLRIVTPGFIKAIAGGMATDAVFRGTTNIRGSLNLPTAAKRPGGILAGSRAQPSGSGGIADAARMNRYAA